MSGPCCCWHASEAPRKPLPPSTTSTSATTAALTTRQGAPAPRPPSSFDAGGRGGGRRDAEPGAKGRWRGLRVPGHCAPHRLVLHRPGPSLHRARAHRSLGFRHGPDRVLVEGCLTALHRLVDVGLLKGVSVIEPVEPGARCSCWVERRRERHCRASVPVPPVFAGPDAGAHADMRQECAARKPTGASQP